MKIEMGIAVYTKEELKWLKAGLSNLLSSTKNEINLTLYLSHITDPILEQCIKISQEFNINLEPRGDDCIVRYYDELRHRAFDINNYDCAVVTQPDVIFSKRNCFDDIMDEASNYFDSTYEINVSSDLENDTLPLAVQIFTKKEWNEVGCGDINYFPAPGSEYDMYRRSCIVWNPSILDNKEEYNKYLDGIHTPPWTHRIRNKNLIHVHKFRGDTGKEYPRDSELFRKATEYSSLVITDCLRFFDAHFLEYHYKKWGGVLGEEKFIFPFNDETKSVKIDWKDQLDPYPDSGFISLKGLVV